MQVSRRTFTSAARRADIVEHAIATIAKLGYGGASFAQIAKRAGLSSTRLISYHFAGKEELMDEVARRVLEEFAGFVRPRVERRRTCAGQLRAFLESNVDFIRAHRTYLQALVEILGSARDSSATRGNVAAIADSDLTAMQELLRDGQRRGEFRRFDTRVMAVAVLAMRNAVIARLAAEPDLDMDIYRRELVTLVELATRKEKR